MKKKKNIERVQLSYFLQLLRIGKKRKNKEKKQSYDYDSYGLQKTFI